MNKSTRTGLGFVALSAWALALFACGAGELPPPSSSPPPVVIVPAPASPPNQSAEPAASGPLTAPPRPPLACKLPAPKKSGDPCQTDAECGPSVPCHAPACVSKAKSPPRPLNMMCTMTFGCDTADANRCGCYEGSCALIPPT